MKDEKIIKQEDGSALILAVVLVSLLAIVGVLFIMVARVDKISASSIAENRQLNHVVDTVIAEISQRLAWDVPDPCQEYYDYPDQYNPWLANLEPYVVRHPTDPNLDEYYWRQISDVTGYLFYYRGFQVQNVNVDPPGNRKVILEYPEIKQDINGNFLDVYDNILPQGLLADADGDGIADSKWIELDDITSGKGKPIYAAIRIVDNLGMINVNTAYRFNPNDPNAVDIDGSSQMQVKLMDLNDTIIYKTDLARNPTSRPHLNYQNDVIWKLEGPIDPCYLPFDISDELDLRYRYCIVSLAFTRLENLWNETIGHCGDFIDNPYDGHTTVDPKTCRRLDDWRLRVTDILNAIWPDRRHFITNYNMDRIIDPNGDKMANVNTEIDKYRLSGAIEKGLREGGIADANMAAQIAVNLIDFRDNDSNITTINVGAIGNTYYGFETPCVYISELAQSFYDPCNVFDVNHPPGPNDPNLYKSYAIELHKPYVEDNIPDPNRWLLVIDGRPIPIVWTGTSQFHLLTNRYPWWKIKFENIFDSNFPIPPNGAVAVDRNIDLYWPKVTTADSYDVYFGMNFNDVNNDSNTVFKGNQTANTFDPGTMDVNTTYYWRINYIDANVVFDTTGVLRFTVSNPVSQEDPNVVFVGTNLIELRRPVDSNYITVDSVFVPIADLNAPNKWWIDVNDANGHIAGHSWQRDISPHKCIRRLWDRLLSRGGFPSLGGRNNYEYEDPNINPIQAHPENKRFTNIGEVGMILRRSAYSENPAMTIGPADTEYTTRLNLADPNYQQIFKYLTVFDPTVHGADPNETRIKGRININTAPWYVLAQLPWVSQRKGGYNNALVREIVAYRDRVGGFKSIGELNRVVDLSSDPNAPINSINYYARDGTDLAGFPDLTPGGVVGDGAPDDFEERDVIFSRISNLVTVRSDVYTAYILVRIGASGPQKRVIAILDRSNVHSPADKVKVIAVQQVPEAR